MIAIYARQSLDKKDSISIDTQIDFCKKEIMDNAEYEVFQDKGYSGKNIERPEFSRLMKKVESKEVNKVIVYKLDRISRSITDFSNIMDILEENKVSFVSASEKFDTSTPVGHAMLYIIMVFAQLERETIAERIRDNYYARGKTGVWLGGPAPLGFTNKKIKSNGKMISILIPNSDLETVREIYDLYSTQNISLGGIAKILLNKHDAMWNNVKLSRILHNPVYVKADVDIYNYYKYKKCIIINDIFEFTGKNGCGLYGKRDRGSNKYRLTSEHVLSLSMHEGIIDSQTWLACQRKLEANKQIKNTGKGKHSWLTGLLKCGYCGYTMNVKVYKDVKYINCTGRYTTNLCIDKLSTHYLSDIEDYISKSLGAYLKNLNGRTIEKNVGQSADTNLLKIKLYEIESQIEKLIESIASGNNVLIDYVNKKIVELDNQRNKTLSEINETTVKKSELILPDLSSWDTFDIETKKEIAHRFIEKINVLNERIEVVWKY